MECCSEALSFMKMDQGSMFMQQFSTVLPQNEVSGVFVLFFVLVSKTDYIFCYLSLNYLCSAAVVFML